MLTIAGGVILGLLLLPVVGYGLILVLCGIGYTIGSVIVALSRFWRD